MFCIAIHIHIDMIFIKNHQDCLRFSSGHPQLCPQSCFIMLLFVYIKFYNKTYLSSICIVQILLPLCEAVRDDIIGIPILNAILSDNQIRMPFPSKQLRKLFISLFMTIA